MPRDLPDVLMDPQDEEDPDAVEITAEDAVNLAIELGRRVSAQDRLIRAQGEAIQRLQKQVTDLLGVICDDGK